MVEAEKVLEESEKNPRKMEEITKEYTLLCGTAGDLSYRAAAMRGDAQAAEDKLKSVFQRMFELNKEAKEAGSVPVAAAVAGEP